MTDDELTLTICRILGGLDGWNFFETGTYPPDKVAVFYGAIADSPDSAVGVTVYGGGDTDLSTRRVQLRSRGPKGFRPGADRYASQAFAELHERIRGDGISSIIRLSFGPLGTDKNGRAERSDNYEITLEN